MLRKLNPKGRYNSKAQTDSGCTGISCENIFLYGLLGIEDVKHIKTCLVRSNLLGYEEMKNC